MSRPGGAGRLRIIGGRWRSRLIAFDPGRGVRPTPDRVRQTLFDWLAPRIEGAHCLDLFAGSGALGLEALSRGAATCTFVDAGGTQIAAINAALLALGAAGQAEVLAGDARAWLARDRRRYEIVFVDPPYGSGLLEPVLQALPRHLAGGNRVFLEWPEAARPRLPPGAEILREKAAGQVSYALATFQAEAEAAP
jgi:16S rRNA (guanine966-N2)-methyltransferase